MAVNGKQEQRRKFSPQELWAYYTAVEEKLNETEGKKPDQKGQSNFSNWWYYVSQPVEELNTLTRAFLGDIQARCALKEERRGLLQWDQFALEGIFLGDEAEWNSQRKAIKLAMTQPISFIIGPPGNGKTIAILNLASCILHQPRKKNGDRVTVAILSNNKAALENIHKKVAEEVEENGGPHWKQLQQALALLGNKELRKKFYVEHCQQLKERYGEKQVEQFFQFRNGPAGSYPKGQEDAPVVQSASREGNVKAQPFLNEYPIITSTICSFKRLFVDGVDFQYDYVIVDECSQVDVVAGLIAMSGAKHLVLVGDPYQLPPVLNEEMVATVHEELKEQLGNKMPPSNHTYRVRAERSFFDCCLELFGDRAIRKVLGYLPDYGRMAQNKADGHYYEWCLQKLAPGERNSTYLMDHRRCHPGIIGFCDQAVYRRNGLPLHIMTKDCTPYYRTYCRNDCAPIPIRVLWFDGNYGESCFYAPGKQKHKDKEEREQRMLSSKKNQKQIEIFMAEEWPELLKRQEIAAQQGESLSVSVLSPYKGQLYALEQALGHPKGMRIAISGEDGKDDDAGSPLYELTIQRSTIHKAQGQEFDLVYLLPVDDGNWEWPWSQKRNLINVAVSRAKRELRIITSSELMDAETRRQLVGHGQEQQREPADDPSGDNLFLQKLLRYVKEADPDGYPESRHPIFGFHQSQTLCSVFDGAAGLQQQIDHSLGEMSKRELERVHQKYDLWGTEISLIHAILDSTYFRENNLVLYRGVRLRDILDAEGNTPDYGEQVDYLAPEQESDRLSPHLDLVITTLEGRILLAIEVDGSYHRYRAMYETDKDGKTVRVPDLSIQLSDAAKDEAMEAVFDAEIFRGNCKEGQEQVEQKAAGGFTFLRLPTDGSTCWEVDAVKDQAAGQAIGWDSYFTIETLLRRQLERVAEEGTEPFFMLDMKSLKKSMDQWREQSEEAKAYLNGMSADGQKSPFTQVLQQHGYLTLSPYPVLGGPKREWLPTEAKEPKDGKEKHDRSGIAVGYRFSSKEGCYSTTYYPLQTRQALLAEILRWNTEK